MNYSSSDFPMPSGPLTRSGGRGLILIETPVPLACPSPRTTILMSIIDVKRLSTMSMPPFKIPTIAVDPDSPFANDGLNRKDTATTLTSLLESVEHQPLVLAVNAPWGFGKTTFIRMWVAALRGDGWGIVEFNAWENDFSENAFASIVAELEDGLKEAVGDSKIEKALDRVKDAGTRLAKRLIPYAAKLATYGLVDGDRIQELVASIAEDAASDVVKYYIETKASIVEFKSKLSDLASQTRENTGKPLVVFIDELDRCRPTYAIEMLEAVKHLFDVSNIAFVIAIDRSQLCNSLRAVYGADLNANEYLRRFIDLEFSLPNPSDLSYLKVLWGRFHLDDYANTRNTSGSKEEALFLYKVLSKLYEYLESELSLRAQEQIFTRLSVVLRMVKEDHFMFPEALAFLLFAREIDKGAYNSFVSRSISPQELLQRVVGKSNKTVAKSFLKSDTAARVEGILLGLARERDYSDVLRFHTERCKDESADKGDRSYSINVIRTHDHFSLRHEGALHNYLIPKIEIADQFVEQNS